MTFDVSFVRNVLVTLFDFVGADYDWYDSSDSVTCTLLEETSTGPRPDKYLSYQTTSVVPVGWGSRAVGSEYPQQQFDVHVRVTAYGSDVMPILFDAALRATGDDVIDAIEPLGADIVGVSVDTVDLRLSGSEYASQRIAIMDITLACTLVATRVIEGAQTVTISGSSELTFQMEDPP